MKKTLAAITATIALAACESTSSLPYTVSTQNVLAAQAALTAADATLSVGSFTASAGVQKPTCRMMGQLDVAPGKDLATFIRDALEAELFQTGRLQSGSVPINGAIERVEVDSFGTGSWIIDARVFSDANPQGYRVSSTYPFSSSFSAYSACQNAATAFNPAVQALLSEIVTHPQFASLAR